MHDASGRHAVSNGILVSLTTLCHRLRPRAGFPAYAFLSEPVRRVHREHRSRWRGVMRFVRIDTAQRGSANHFKHIRL